MACPRQWYILYSAHTKTRHKMAVFIHFKIVSASVNTIGVIKYHLTYVFTGYARSDDTGFPEARFNGVFPDFRPKRTFVIFLIFVCHLLMIELITYTCLSFNRNRNI